MTQLRQDGRCASCADKTLMGKAHAKHGGGRWHSARDLELRPRLQIIKSELWDQSGFVRQGIPCEGARIAFLPDCNDKVSKEASVSDQVGNLSERLHVEPFPESSEGFIAKSQR